MTRALSLLWPFLVVPAVVFAIMESWISLGGGEKDIFVALPLLLFAVLYFLAGLLFWARGRAPLSATWRSVLAVLLLLVLAWLALFAAELAGVSPLHLAPLPE